MSNIIAADSNLNRIRQSISTHQLHPRIPYLMLFLRFFLFAGWQAVFALIFWIQKRDAPWEQSIAFWVFGVALANFVCIYIVSRLFQKEGISYWKSIGFSSGTILRDALTAVGLFLLAGPIGYLPNVICSKLIFGSEMIPVKMMFRELPMTLAIAGVILFPLTQAFVELPTYFTYIMPRIEAVSGKKWMAIGLASFFLAFQHLAVPLIFDLRFMLWRLVMFLPFALFLGIVLRWKPKLIPYLMIGHFLIDLSTAIYIIPGLIP